MRTTHACMACLASVLAAAPLVLTHCSGSNSSSKLNDAGSGSGSGGSFGSSGSGSGGSSGTSSGSSGGEDAGASSGGSSGAGSDASSSGVVGQDGGQTGEAGGSSGGGATCQTPDGGAPCDPGIVSCGSMSCTTASTYCCSDLDGGGTCDPYNGGSCASGVKYQCNEAADCMSGVCCEADQYGPHSSSCMPSCPVGNFQVCRTDSECGVSDAGGPKKCILQTCPTSAGGGAGGPGFPGGPGGGSSGGSSSGGAVATITIEACSYPTTGAMGVVTWGPLPACTAK
jgi:hypothetical protein